MELIMVTMWLQYHLSVNTKIIIKPTDLTHIQNDINILYLKYL